MCPPIAELVSDILQAVDLKQLTIATLLVDLRRSLLCRLSDICRMLFGEERIISVPQYGVVDNYFQVNGTVIHHHYIYEHRFPQIALLVYIVGAIGLLIVLFGAVRYFLHSHREPRTPVTDLVHGGGKTPTDAPGGKVKALVHGTSRKTASVHFPRPTHATQSADHASTGGSRPMLPWSTKATAFLMESPWSAVAARTTVRERRSASGAKQRGASGVPSAPTARFARRRAIAATSDVDSPASETSSADENSLFEYDIVDPCARPIPGWFDYYDDNSPGWLLPVIEQLKNSESRRNSVDQHSGLCVGTTPRSSFSHPTPSASTFSSLAILSDADASADLSHASGLNADHRNHANDVNLVNRPVDGHLNDSHPETARDLSREPLYWNPPPSAESGQWAYPSPFAFSGMAVDDNLFATESFGTYPGSELTTQIGDQ
ncbi:hypothetical protein GY45DRAFT_1317573 [Cubamyces sp. BRFM 1775]|nr:hypothetical protein GY45DRAFT_1317573 [Cubamyces sp. BRFM 1775]